MEANCLRFLQFVQKRYGVIESILYEPLGFTVGPQKIRYVPDFKITYEDGYSLFLEVKGFLDYSSIAKIQGFKKTTGLDLYYIGNQEYKRIERNYKYRLKNWE